MKFDTTHQRLFVVTLTSNASQNSTNLIVPGMIYTFCIKQDGTGGHEFAWPANCQNAVPVALQPHTITTQNFVGLDEATMSANLPGTWTATS